MSNPNEPAIGLASPGTPSDGARAIEFAEYLAVAAEEFMQACNRREEVRQAALTGTADDDACNNADESYSEHFRALGSAIYEFRKRAERARGSAMEFESKSVEAMRALWMTVRVAQAGQQRSDGVAIPASMILSTDWRRASFSVKPLPGGGYRYRAALAGEEPPKAEPRRLVVIACRFDQAIAFLAEWKIRIHVPNGPIVVKPGDSTFAFAGLAGRFDFVCLPGCSREQRDAAIAYRGRELEPRSMTPTFDPEKPL
jgi:hypothetical protein